jgi:hypothetical protein
MTYATTPLFLEYFGLRSLEELPAADELRKIVVERPEALLTVENGGAQAAATPSESVQENPELPSATPVGGEEPASPNAEGSPEIPVTEGAAPSSEPAEPELPQ